MMGSVSPTRFLRDGFLEAAMIRTFAVGVLAMIVGCGPSEPTQRRITQVGWASLVNEYRDNPRDADERYRNKVIQVYLPRKSFCIADERRIEAYFGVPGSPGAIVFEHGGDVFDARLAILVTGTCRGIVRDGVERTNRVTWFVRVDQCVVTELSQ